MTFQPFPTLFLSMSLLSQWRHYWEGMREYWSLYKLPLPRKLPSERQLINLQQVQGRTAGTARNSFAEVGRFVLKRDQPHHEITALSGAPTFWPHSVSMRLGRLQSSNEGSSQCCCSKQSRCSSCRLHPSSASSSRTNCAHLCHRVQIWSDYRKALPRINMHRYPTFETSKSLRMQPYECSCKGHIPVHIARPFNALHCRFTMTMIDHDPEPVFRGPNPLMASFRPPVLQSPAFNPPTNLSIGYVHIRLMMPSLIALRSEAQNLREQLLPYICNTQANNAMQCRSCWLAHLRCNPCGKYAWRLCRVLDKVEQDAM